MSETINPGDRLRTTIPADHMCHVTSDALASGKRWFSLDTNSPSIAIGASADVVLGPWATPVVLMVDCIAGSITVDTNYIPAVPDGEPAVPLASVTGAQAAVDARLSAEQRTAIDALDAESEASDIVDALQTSE